MSSSGAGCIFEHYGRIPDNIYRVEIFRSPLEEAVFKNDLQTFMKLKQEGHIVSVGLKIGEMSCIEYASMMGYADVLRALLDESMNAAILHQYFSLDDVVDRAYLLSKHKEQFIAQEALAEANRYEAALFTAVQYNQPACVEVLMGKLGLNMIRKHMFHTEENRKETLSASELAKLRGHSECYDILATRESQMRAC